MKFTATQFLTVVACGLVLFGNEASAAKPILDLPTGLAKAKEQKKPVFIYVFDSI